MDSPSSENKTNKLFSEFPPVSRAQWEEVIQEDLKGADYEKKLIWQSPEGVKVKPYYTEEDVPQEPGFPGVFPFTRGNQPVNSWFIRQEISVGTLGIEGANRKALEILQKGADSVGFVLPAEMKLMYEDFCRLMDNIWVKGIEVNFVAEHQAIDIASFLRRLMDDRNRDYERLKGSLNFDPLGYLSQHGRFCPDCKTAEGAFDEAKRLVETLKDLPNVKALSINGALFANAGADIVQELAFSLSAGVEYLTQLTGRGLSVSLVAPRLRFVFSSGSNYFFEIAKLRAARQLWAHIVKAYGPASDELCKMNIHSITTVFNKTLYDPYVNMLRTTTEAMAATLGGADSLEILPFDFAYGNTQEFGERIARNQQLILKEEAWFDKVNDPAAGSYYIESLTGELCHEAWKLFLKLEEKGGYLSAFIANVPQQMIRETALKKEAAVASRRETVLGTNQYPNVTERIEKELGTELISKPLPSEEALMADPILPYRASVAMEALRYRTDLYSHSHKRPSVYLLLTGNVGMRQARAQFSGNFFGCAGFEIITGKAVASPAEGIAAAKESAAEIVVICASDDDYALTAPDIHAGLKDHALVVVAGNPPCADDLRRIGLNRFIHVRSNLLETLLQFQKDLNIA